MKIVAPLAIFSLSLMWCAWAKGADGAGKLKWPRSIEIAQGELVELKISGADLATVEGRWGEEQIYFQPMGNGLFSALFGVDVEAKAAVSKFILKVVRRSGEQRQTELPVKVKAKSFDQMTPETQEEISREQTAFKRAFAAPIAARLWEAPFIRPVPHEASPTSFGARRIINGAPRAPHSGTDLAAPAGVEVLASNHGQVALVGNFFFEGAMVKKGDVVGISGATGRVTGPHLHWGARLTNARVEPFELLKKISLPSSQTQELKSNASKTEK
jgi:murein DD-endopeptidase MepM/ murein hydrolase activator NlpD